MGALNFLVEGVTGTGKTSVCHELRRRGYDAVNGDTDLAIRLSPGLVPTSAEDVHGNHGWDATLVRSLAADRAARFTFFCGGSRNSASFLDVFDAVFVLEIDRATLLRRLDARADDDWGSTPEQRDLVLRLHATGDDVPPGMAIDATAPLETVVDELLTAAKAFADRR
ncbi:nucleoside kinase [Nocardioides oleivorans]|uniref:Nucleoside kinase n=1 Tax=Nocardioides oleivorans TaxID=273676 RepID=A0A4Q2RVB0_9ACTN|nr:nucleoside kinase [Nocardioides oleivorans]RYB93111.1 nucleoside kinase [Nocardioides oleivorans]